MATLAATSVIICFAYADNASGKSVFVAKYTNHHSQAAKPPNQADLRLESPPGAASPAFGGRTPAEASAKETKCNAILAKCKCKYNLIRTRLVIGAAVAVPYPNGVAHIGVEPWLIVDRKCVAANAWARENA